VAPCGGSGDGVGSDSTSVGAGPRSGGGGEPPAAATIATAGALGAAAAAAAAAAATATAATAAASAAGGASADCRRGRSIRSFKWSAAATTRAPSPEDSHDGGRGRAPPAEEVSYHRLQAPRGFFCRTVSRGGSTPRPLDSTS